MARACYRVEHLTRYDYADTVSVSQHVAYLEPRAHPNQRLHAHTLVLDPAPAQRDRRVDYFGNPVLRFALAKAHASLRVTATSLVELRSRPDLDPTSSPTWELVRDRLHYRMGAPAHEAHRFAFASPYVALEPELAAFARPSFTPGRPLLDAAVDLMHRIHAEFRFDPHATTITTPVKRVLAERRGVCQDFAHLQLSCLRSLGLAARYVSGYLLTDPPPGRARLIGADASHAWVSVYCPVNGWVDLDPTNDAQADLRHVTLAWGRDYGDVCPLRGVMLGGATHRLTVGVSVIPLEPNAFETETALAGRPPD